MTLQWHAHPDDFLLIYGLEPANKTAGDGLFRRVKGPRHQNKQCVLPKELPARQDETNPTLPMFSPFAALSHSKLFFH